MESNMLDNSVVEERARGYNVIENICGNGKRVR